MARKPNFTPQELSVLVDLVDQHRQVLFSKFKNARSNAAKTQQWQHITDRVNAVGLSCRRTVEDIRSKWRDYSSVTKRKAATLRRERERTGGGRTSLPSLTAEEERVVAILGPEALEGVPGGIDMFARRRTSAPESPPCQSQGPSTSTSILPQGPSTPTVTPSEDPSTPSQDARPPLRCRRSLRAAVSPASPERHWSESPPTPLGRPSPLQRNRCDCSVELLRSEEQKIAILRGIKDELTDLREQQERHHQETMAYRRQKLALAVSKPSFMIHLPTAEGKF
ncbi:myb-related transcription factor, partner of profilin-like [Alosa alosa]|uniref:myb-related transcription factor, partner of profilin-like n=1 Tax=Alosa alosa TaxID=278164 RepID=UPI0020150F7C|nr:myb-related transcription factor, partner of profilin-like [Alosa alosa]